MSFQNTEAWQASAVLLGINLEAAGCDLQAFQRAVNTQSFTVAVLEAVAAGYTIDDFKEELGTKLYNILKKEGFEYMSDLTKWTEWDFCTLLRNFGPASLDKLKAVMQTAGYQPKVR